jgi:hypothetical protein
MDSQLNGQGQIAGLEQRRFDKSDESSRIPLPHKLATTAVILTLDSPALSARRTSELNGRREIKFAIRNPEFSGSYRSDPTSCSAEGD